MAKQFTLGKNERLKSRKLIEQLFNEGKGFSIAPFKVYYLIIKQKDVQQSMQDRPRGIFNLQFGVGVSRKTFKKAVERNRIKRLTREVFRLQKKELQEILKQKDFQLNIFFIYTGKELPDFKTVEEKVRVALQKIVGYVENS